MWKVGHEASFPLEIMVTYKKISFVTNLQSIGSSIYVTVWMLMLLWISVLVHNTQCWWNEEVCSLGGDQMHFKNSFFFHDWVLRAFIKCPCWLRHYVGAARRNNLWSREQELDPEPISIFTFDFTDLRAMSNTFPLLINYPVEGTSLQQPKWAEMMYMLVYLCVCIGMCFGT